MRLALLASLALACGGQAAPPTKSAPIAVELTDWKPLSFGSYLAPVSSAPSVTLIWHFHACRAAENDYRSLAGNIVVVCLDNLGMGTAPYWDAFKDPHRFGVLEREVMAALGPGVHVERTVLVAWSAGYASIQQILNAPDVYDRTSAVVLLDGLHAGYTKNADGSPTRVANIDTVGSLLRFARDASTGNKAFVFTHSAVVPVGYASTTEMAHALEDRLTMVRGSADPDFAQSIDVADLGNLHVRGFAGGRAKHHITQLHWLAPVLRKWVLISH